MATVKKSLFSRGAVSYRTGGCLVALITVVTTVSAATLPPVHSTDEQGHRHFRFSPDNFAENFLDTLVWPTANGYQTGDVFEFEESDEPYVLTKEIDFKVGWGKHELSFVGVKADGSPADPEKVVFVPSDGITYGLSSSNYTNTFANITFSNVVLGVQTGSAHAPFTFANCVFTGVTKQNGLVFKQRSWTQNNPVGIVSAIDCRFEGIAGTQCGVARGWLSFAATNCVFTCCTNTATGFTAGTITADINNLSCYNCVFADNVVPHGQGAGALNFSQPGKFVLDRCVFSNNAVDVVYTDRHEGGGGAIAIYGAATGTVQNCLFVGNGCTRANEGNGFGGGAIMVRNAKAVVSVENCTFVENVASNPKQNAEGGGAIWAWRAASVGITNCIFHANRARLAEVANLKLLDWTTVGNSMESNFEYYGTTYDFSSIDTGATPTTHIINGVNGCLVGDYDPKFTDAANGDFTLEKKSPCRDAGALLSWMTPSSLDLAGTARVFGDHPDIGCYEWWQKLMGLTILMR